MKKKIFSFLVIVLSLFFIGCNQNNGFKYEFDDSILNTQIYANEFDISQLQLKIIKNNEVVGYVVVDETMVTNDDFAIRHLPGTYDITIKYENYKHSFTITLLEDVIEYEFDQSVICEKYYIDEFDISSLRLKVIKNGNFSEYINVSIDMLSSEDIELLKTVGTHSITIEYNGFKYTFTITLLEHEEEKVFYSDNAYYNKANGYTGEKLKSALRTIISVTKKTETYGELRTDLAKTDADPNNPSNIMLIYTGLSVSSKWDSGKTWNREHIWPQSLGWFKETGAGADLHHIRPANPSENSSRGNKRFGSSTNNKFYEPRDEVKGDIARIIFYLMVRYQEADNYTFKTVAESKELLLAWNIMDPVDEFEMNRNEIIYSIQGNRNPFVDNPECAELIWGSFEVNTKFCEESITIDIIYFIDDRKNKEMYNF